MIDHFESWVMTVLLLGLRIGPLFIFAPPFTLLRIPVSVRLVLSLAISMWLTGLHPQNSYLAPFAEHGILATAAGELLLGASIALSFQVVFAALYTAGRTIDVQAGFGLATLIEPATRSRTPLIGTLFAYIAGIFFFTMNGPVEMLALWSASLNNIALGSAILTADPGLLMGHIATSFTIAFGLAAVVLLALFLTDMTVAAMAKTLPQMHVMLLGFQIKAMLLLIMLPISITSGATLFLRLIRLALDNAGMVVR
ncbi:MAG: flagellar biosynthetic protein FliR [Pseudomonadota bacterium]